MNPYVFFVGCARSGTTLLARLGNGHPELAITRETAWIARWYEERIGLTPDGRVTPDLLVHLRENPGFSKLGISEAELEELLDGDEPLTYSAFITALFDRYGERKGKRFVGDKSPRFVRFLPTLHSLWPEAKFVHIIRDGRDVCLSVLDWNAGPAFSTWDEDPIGTVALWWEWHVRLGRETGSPLGADRYMELRYESLVGDPEGECERLCAFLGLPYDERMLRFHEGRTRSRRSNPKTAWLPVTAGLRSWTEQMGSKDVERFETVAGALLDELGYPRAPVSLEAGRADHVAQLREAFAEEARARGLAIPNAWSSTA